MLEAEHVGFGASGRNGGWVLGAVAGRRRHARPPARPHGDPRPARRAARHRRRGGPGRRRRRAWAPASSRAAPLVVARTPAQEARARVDAAHAASWDDGTVWLDAAATRERLDVAGARRRHLHPALRPRAPAPARRRAGRRGAPARRPDRRAAPTWHASATGSWCSPTATGSPPRTSSSPPRAGRAPCPGCAAGRPGLLADGGHRADRRRALGADRARRPRDVRRPRPPGHLRPAHRRRPDRLRRPRRAVPLGLRRSGPSSTRSPGSSTRCARRCATCSPSSTASGSPTPGAARSASPATGTRR